MKKILVTGCNGQLGREINRFYKDRNGIELINTDVEELDITNIKDVTDLVESEKPYAIINCAAYTAVDACETNQDIAFKVNVIGPRNLAIASKLVGARMIHISTDYVFDGTKQTPYYESDPICPQSVYGQTKAEAEKMVTMFADRFFIFRTAWLYGDGKNFVRTMLRLSEDHDEVRVVNDQFGTPTSTAELVKAIDSILFTRNYGIYHATCEGSCDWAEFAREIFRLAGKSTKVTGISTEEYGAPANRPAHSVLENRMLKAVGGYTFCDWHDAIKTYLEQELK
jgi:dTDP-4-dehydrorhamnose reductase